MLDLIKIQEFEFILQVAYYLRNNLYIRTTTNFIVAFAATTKGCQQFLKKYFNKTVLLPSDLLDVVKFTQLIKYWEI